jgi:urease accessory protein
MAPSPTLRSLLPAAAAGLGLSLLSLLPAGAHGVAGGDLASGASHPLLGLDHLLLLVALGATALRRDASVLAFAAAGALLGAVLGSAGAGLPAAETLAALAVSAVAALALGAGQRGQGGSRALSGAISAAALAVHALLHAQEAPGQAAVGWWLGAGLASTAVVAATMLLLSRLPQRAGRLLAAGLILGGGLLALAQPG